MESTKKMGEPCIEEKNQTVPWHSKESESLHVMWENLDASGSGRITIPITQDYFLCVDRTTKLQYKGLTIRVNHAEYCWHTKNIHLGSIKTDLQKMKHAQSFCVEKYFSFPSFN